MMTKIPVNFELSFHGWIIYLDNFRSKEKYFSSWKNLLFTDTKSQYAYNKTMSNNVDQTEYTIKILKILII